MRQNIYTLLTCLLVFLMSTQLSAQITPCEGSSCDGPIEITSFGDSTNIMAGDGFPRQFKRGDTIHIIGGYVTNENLTLDSLWVTHDVYAADWSGLEYEGEFQFVYNGTKGIGAADGVIDFKYVVPEDAPFFGDFHDTTTTDPIANHIIQVRAAYTPDVNTFWNIFIQIVPDDEPEETPIVDVDPCQGSSCNGPIMVTSFADSTNVIPGDGFPRQFNRGDTINIKGMYGINPNLTLDSIWVTHDVYAADWSGLEYEGAFQFIANAAKNIGTVNGEIDFNYIVPEDAPFFGDFHDANMEGAPPANHIIQIRAAYTQDIDVFWNIFVQIVPEDDGEPPVVDVDPCQGSSCNGPIMVTSFADSTNVIPGDGFPRQFNRGDTINIKGMYGINPNLTLDSIWVTHDVYAADWSGLEYEGELQFIANAAKNIGTVNGEIDFNYIVPEDAPFFGDFHDANMEGAPPANHIIQIRAAYTQDIDVFWNIFVQIVPEDDGEPPVVDVDPCEGSSCNGPILITSFADSTNVLPGDNFPVSFDRGDTINIKGMYGINPNLTLDSLWVTHDVYAADWSGLEYEGVPQIVASSSVGSINGIIDFDYIVPADAPYFGDFHDTTMVDGPQANHIIQIRAFYAQGIDVFWNIFVKVAPEGVVATVQPVLQGLEIYPNPAKDQLTIKTPNNLERRILIFDLAGKLIMDEKLRSNNLDISRLTEGFHLLRVEEDGKVATRKLIIKH